MKQYKYMCYNSPMKTKVVCYTSDKILADFMNKGLTFWERIILFFS